jgi:hypothetical protein
MLNWTDTLPALNTHLAQRLALPIEHLHLLADSLTLENHTVPALPPTATRPDWQPLLPDLPIAGILAYHRAEQTTLTPDARGGFGAGQLQRADTQLRWVLWLHHTQPGTLAEWSVRVLEAFHTAAQTAHWPQGYRLQVGTARLQSTANARTEVPGMSVPLGWRVLVVDYRLLYTLPGC